MNKKFRGLGLRFKDPLYFTLSSGYLYLLFLKKYIHGQLNNPIYYIARDKKQIEEKYNEIIIDDENIEDNNGIPIDLDNG